MCDQFSPVERLPDDILRRIFEERTVQWEADDHAGFTSRQNRCASWYAVMRYKGRQDPFLSLTRDISLVSKRWLNAALDTPRLWSNVVVPDDADSVSFDVFAMMVKRSKACPLHLFIRNPNTVTRGISALLSLQSVHRVTQLSLYDTLGEDLTPTFSQKSLEDAGLVIPNLKYLRITLTPSISLSYAQAFRTYFNALQVDWPVDELWRRDHSLIFHIRSLSEVTPTSPAFSCLHHLTTDHALDLFFELMSRGALTQLQSLRLTGVDYHQFFFGDHLDPLSLLPDLKFLDIRGFDARYYLVDLLRRAPNLQALDLIVDTTFLSTPLGRHFLRVLEEDQDIILPHLQEIRLSTVFIPIKAFVRILHRRAARGTPLQALSITPDGLHHILPKNLQELKDNVQVIEWRDGPIWYPHAEV